MSPDAPAREQWSGKWEVLLSYIGFSVGIGNIWRFCYLCYKNGGGAFLLPYITILIIAGIPVYYLEISLGQYSAKSATHVWSFCPLFKGIGFCMLMYNIYCVTYFFMLIAYILRFLVASLTSELPWATCDNEWNTPLCRSSQHTNLALSNVTLFGNESSVVTIAPYNMTANATKFTSAAEEYWENKMLHKSDGIYPLGGFEWELVLSLAVSAFIMFLCLCRGIKSTGKVVYFTATFPYVVIFILLVRGVTLPGAIKGIMFYVIPDFKRLLDFAVWGDAASQIFFSLGQAWGILITYGSYNKFNHNSRRDTLVVCTICPLTSICAGLVVFSTIGFLSEELNAPVSDVMASGPGLAFVAYPEALARMPLAPLWSFFFFFMMFIVGVDSTFCMLEVVITAAVDEFPKYLRKWKTPFTALCCLFIFCLALPLTTRAGIYIVTLLDWYAVTFPPLTVAFLETFLISHVYGWRRFSENICEMRGMKPSYYWIISWTIIVPVVVTVILIFNIIMYTPATHGDYVYPSWAESLGWLTCASSIVCIPVTMVIQMYLKAGSARAMFRSPIRTMRALLTPEPSWRSQIDPGPKDEELKALDAQCYPDAQPMYEKA